MTRKLKETQLTERWGYAADEHQTILIEHTNSKGGRNPRTGEQVPPKSITKESYHPTLRAAVLAAINAEAGQCETLEQLVELTERWERLAGLFDSV